MEDIERKAIDKVRNLENSTLTVKESSVDADSVILCISDRKFNSKNIDSNSLARLLRENGVYDLWAESDKIYVQVTEEFYEK